MKRNIQTKLIAILFLLSFIHPIAIYAEWEMIKSFDNGHLNYYIDDSYGKRSKFGNYLITIKMEHIFDPDPNYYRYKRETHVEIETFEVHKSLEYYRDWPPKYDNECGDWHRTHHYETEGYWPYVWQKVIVYLLPYKFKEENAAREAAEKKEAERLARLPAQLDIVLSDKDDEIQINIDGKPYSVTKGHCNNELKKGEHTIRISKKNHRDYKQEITLSPGEKRQIRIPKLIPIVGALYISSDIEGAKAFLDDKQVGKTPVLATDIIIGDHEVKIIKEGGDSIVKKINIVEMPADSIEPQIIYQQFPKTDAFGYQYVDLGLPSGTLWATCNLGAESPVKYGDKYAWGQITPEDFSSIPYKKRKKYIDNIEKSNKKFAKNIVKSGIRNISGIQEYDAARSIMGGAWRLPTKEEIKELIDNCNFEVMMDEQGKSPIAIKVVGKNAEMIIRGGDYSCGNHYEYSKDDVYYLDIHSYCNEPRVYFSAFSTEYSRNIRPVFTPCVEHDVNKQDSSFTEIKEAAKEAYKHYRQKK